MRQGKTRIQIVLLFPQQTHYSLVLQQSISEWPASFPYYCNKFGNVTQESYVHEHYTNSIHHAGVQSTAQVHRYLEWNSLAAWICTVFCVIIIFFLFTYQRASTTFNSYLLLTPWCRVLLEKLTGLQLVKKFPAFHGSRRFITALTSVYHLSLSWASPIQSINPHPISWRSILILSTHLRLGLPSGLLNLQFIFSIIYKIVKTTSYAL